MPIIVSISETAIDAQTIIDRAMRLIGVLASGASPTAAETADGLEALNSLLDSWRNDRLLCYAGQEEALTLSSGTQTYTVGNGGTLNTNRPVQIIKAYVSYGGNNYDIEILNDKEWASILDRTTTADFPSRINYKAANPLGVISVHPVPSATSSLYILTMVPIEQFESSSDTLYLMPGWRDALAFNLAVAIAPEFNVTASNEVNRMALSSLAGIKRANAAGQPKRLYTDLGAMFSPSNSNIQTDYP